MSVDTYLKRKNLSPYGVVNYGDLKILVAPSLARWAKMVQIDVRRGLFSQSFDVEAEARHEHGPNCAH